MQVLKLNTTESTNSYLKALSKDRALNNCAVIAECQTRGRGCGDKSFFSPEGGLYLSYTFTPCTPPEDTIDITKWAAVAVWNAVHQLFPSLDIKIKPVNDLYLNGKKICGILTEYTGNNLIIGVGINFNTVYFPPNIPATSLLIETGKVTDLQTACNIVLKQMELLYKSWPDKKAFYVSEYEMHRML